MDELEQYRREIDRIDAELVRCFLERMDVTQRWGHTNRPGACRCWTRPGSAGWWTPGPP